MRRRQCTVAHRLSATLMPSCHAVLHIFLATHRTALIERCRLMVGHRSEPKATDVELQHGIPIFLDQLIETLRIEQTSEQMQGFKASGIPGGGAASEIGISATLHGRELLKRGFTLEQVVRDYGDLCQAITNLAFELKSPIAVDEFGTFNRCLDNAIAGAVTEYAHEQSSIAAEEGLQALNTRLGLLSHELRNLVHTATLAVSAIKTGNVGLTGATGAVLDRCLLGLRNLVDRSLAEVRVTAGLPARRQLISLADFIAEVEIPAALEARTKECQFTVPEVDKRLAIEVDRDMMSSAVGNLLQNAFKFTQRRSAVTLHAYAAADRILVDVEDHCGGLPPGDMVRLFRPFHQNGEDRSGLGLGLDICRRSVQANDGTIRVRDVPGVGCVFTIELPRHVLPPIPAPGDHRNRETARSN
jgi:signal transduction histidine kinase